MEDISGDLDLTRKEKGARVRVVRLDTAAPQFAADFEEYGARFLSVLSHSYVSYFGDEYHKRRIIDGGSIVYFALTDDEVVAVSYVKRNRRRGGTAVSPQFRRQGLAEMLVLASLADYPEQYSILETSNVVEMMKLWRGR